MAKKKTAKTSGRGIARSSRGKTAKKDKRKSTTKTMIPPEPCTCEEIPVCPTGVPCILGRDAAQELICIELPLNERYLKGDQTQGVIWTNT